MSIFTPDTSIQLSGNSSLTKTYNTKDNPNLSFHSRAGIYNSADNTIKFFTNNIDALTIDANQKVICNGSLITNIAWGNIDGKPSFFDGTWNSLSGKPTNFQSDWLTTITNKPSLFDGTWTSLSGKPTLFDGTWTSLSGKPTNFQSDWNTTITNKPTLFDGTWTSLSGKPTLFDGTWTSLSGKPTNFQSDWNTTITNKPTLFDGTWTSLSGKPTLFDGTWTSLSGKPTNFQADWLTTITNKPTLFDGTWTSLSGKPTLFDGTWTSLSGKPTNFQADWLTTITNKPTLFDGTWTSLSGKPTLFDGNYNSLTNKPFISSGIDIFTNNQGNTTIGNDTSITAVNGTISQVINDYTSNYCVFLQSGSITFPQNMVCDILVVGGGGSGGSRHAGGGGAGAVIYLTNQTLNAGTYTIYIGTGGTPVSSYGQGNRGQDSSIVYNSTTVIYTAKGGGAGFHADTSGNSNKDGGSGGGGGETAGLAVSTNIPSGSYGNKGGIGLLGISGYGESGYTGGGGGGAGANGQNGYISPTDGSKGIGGDGGIGRQISITGTSTYYGGGGGGGCASTSQSAGNGGQGGGGAGSKGATTATSGTANTGGGGGGAGFVGGSNGTSGAGGSGIVIIRYKIPNLIVKNNFAVSGDLILDNGSILNKSIGKSLILGTENTERVRILNNGNVGIGSTIPAFKLDVAGDVNITGNYKVNGVNFTGSKWTTTGNNIHYSTGNVGIGFNNPSQKLSVNGVGEFATANGNKLIFSYTNNDYKHRIYTGHNANTDSGNHYDFFVWRAGQGVNDDGDRHCLRLSATHTHFPSSTNKYFWINNRINDYGNNDYTSTPFTIFNQTASSSTVLNDPQRVLALSRQGTSSQTYGQTATFKLCRWENSSTNSRTRLDIDLSDGGNDDVNIMTIRSDRIIGFGNNRPYRDALAPTSYQFLHLGDSTVANFCDWNLVVHKSNGTGGTRHFAIGYDGSFYETIGDNGGNNTGSGNWLSHLSMAYNAPDYSIQLFTNGNVNVYGNLYQGSDIKIKKDIKTINNALWKVQQLRGVYYTHIIEGTKNIGLIAQEVEGIIPEVISYNERTDMKGVNYANLTALLINAVKEQQEIIEAQNARINKIEEILYNLISKEDAI